MTLTNCMVPANVRPTISRKTDHFPFTKTVGASPFPMGLRGFAAHVDQS
jgi:hypothetical protein